MVNEEHSRDVGKTHPGENLSRQDKSNQRTVYGQRRLISSCLPSIDS